MDSSSAVRCFCQKAKLFPCPKTQQRIKITIATGTFFTKTLLLAKYTMDSARRIPAKIRNVMDVPTAGILINVGTKVPMMLPMVFDALRFPTIFPLSSRLSTVYFTRDGVTVPSKNSGNTKMIMHAAKAAITRKLVLMVKTRSPEIPSMIYFPSTGIRAIQTAAKMIRPYSRSGFGFLSTFRPP